MKVIVEIKQSSDSAKSMTMDTGATSTTSIPKLPGLVVDASYSAIELDTGAIATDTDLKTFGLETMLPATSDNTVIIRGEVDEDKRAQLEAHSDVVTVWTDAEIAAFDDFDDNEFAVPLPESEGSKLVMLPDIDDLTGVTKPIQDKGAVVTEAFSLETASPCSPTDCAPTVAKGTITDVANYLYCHRLWAKGIRGDGVAIGIVDTGVDKTKVPNVVDGWTPNATYPWGTDPGGHGTMTATDAKGMAPGAEIYDIGLLKSTAAITGLLSDAIAGFHWALTKYKSIGKPQILSNSWGMYQKAWAPDYATDPNHPFTRKVVEVINAGMLVTFAAGNCGQVCPSGRCGSDTGPGRSIWGANGHPRVITVGAANIREEWIGYSSQGPAALDAHKPDFVAPSHFKGYTASDNGTSAANPVCAGVIALLRGHNPQLRQDAVKEALQKTAKDLCGTDWDRNSGYGMINAERAFNKLNFNQTPLIHASWIHGNTTHVEYPDRLLISRSYGFYGYYQGKANTSNWFHLAIPTPVIVSRRRLRLDSIMLMMWSDPNAIITDVHVWDANRNLKKFTGLNMTGSHWFERFDILNNLVRYGVSVSIGVKFTSATGARRVIFGSCGGDFVA